MIPSLIFAAGIILDILLARAERFAVWNAVLLALFVYLILRNE